MTKVAPSDAGVLFLLCESIRQEQGGKLSLLGLYPGNLLLVPEDTTLVTLPIAFLFLVRDGEGAFSAAVSLISPDGTAIFDKEPIPPTIKEPGKALTVLFQLMPFQTPEIGDFKITLHLDEFRFDREFTIRKAPRPA